jgi:hypothetical protein
MIQRLVHIGYPKNFSTSLQYDFFSAHPQLFHLGIGPQLAYRDPLIDATFEVYLKSAKRFKYAQVEDRLVQHFARQFDEAEQQGKRAVTVSSEHLSFAFSNDALGFEEKIGRLAALMGPDASILAIIRNQTDLIRSLYRESVRVGFPGDFAQYAYLLYKYQDRNYYYDLRYDLIYEVLCRYFSPANVYFLVFEEMRDANGRLILNNGQIRLVRCLCELLNVDYLDTRFGHYNEALDDSVILSKADLNRGTRHDLGNILLDTAEKHRMKQYLFQELGLHEEETALYSDVIAKRALIEQAKNSGAHPNEKLDYSMDPAIAARVKHHYEEGNRRFMQLTGASLPPAYLTLRF